MVKRSLVALAVAFSTAPAAGLAEEGKTVDEKVDEVKGRVDTAEEQMAEMKTDLSSLKKIKFSGYVQGRYLNGAATVINTGDLAPKTSTEGFVVRRGRLKSTYDGSWSQYVLQIDAVPAGVTLKDAEATLKLPWLETRATLGQTKVPLGYEVQQSSGDREMPERARVVRSFAPGERDRGLKVSARWKMLDLKIGVFNGNMVDYKGYSYNGTAVAVRPTGLDNDTKKDVIARLGADLGMLVAGVSGWYGEAYRQPTTIGAVVVPGKSYVRSRVGFDAQLYLDLLPLGGTAIKGEFIAGESPSPGGIDLPGVTAHGYYLLLSQFLTPAFQVVARYDWYDPANGRANTANATGVPGALNSAGTLGVGVLWYADDVFKLTAVYEWNRTGVPAGGKDPADDLFTLQAQAKF